RQIILKARFNEQEATLVKQQADAAGLSVSAVIRFALLDQAPLRASRKPLIDRETGGRILGTLGPMATDIRRILETGNPDASLETLQAILREISDIRAEHFENSGRTP
ncbi:MAG: plasmid mobilization protein, partial [Paracoccus sp. (in: a-proteobacteria)]